MILKNENGNLKNLNLKNFELEKDLQDFVERNMQKILGYTFLDTEFSINSYRFDSVAFDNENDAFVIVEYKRGVNESLVDQGYAYLKTLIDRKADFVLLYNEKTNSNKKKNDFDWSQTKIVFVSPKFTQYQIDATSYGNMPFELYEIRRYENELYDIDKISKSKKTSSIGISKAFETDEMKQVNKEIKVYDEDYHLSRATKITKDLYIELKNRLEDLNLDLIQSYTKNYIVYKKDAKHNIFSLWLKKDWIEVCLHLKQGKLIDNENLTYDISNRQWTNCQYAFKFSKNIDMDYAVDLIKQAYKKSKE